MILYMYYIEFDCESKRIPSLCTQNIYWYMFEERRIFCGTRKSYIVEKSVSWWLLYVFVNVSIGMSMSWIDLDVLSYFELNNRTMLNDENGG